MAHHDAAISPLVFPGMNFSDPHVLPLDHDLILLELG
jgi:hypothetical protein